MRLTWARVVSICLLALLCAVLLGGGLASAENPGSEVTYEIEGRIVARTHADGRIEFCFQPSGEDLVCPDRRFVRPSEFRSDRWLVSSEVSWSIPIVPSRVVQPVAAAVDGSQDQRCDPDFSRMIDSVWIADGRQFRHNAFHVGSGRFLTKSNYLADDESIVTLIHGERHLAAAIVAVDDSRRVALLEVAEPALLADYSEPRLRDPTAADAGAAVFSLFRLHVGPPRVSFGEVLTVVGDGVIQTNENRHGRSRFGLIFDACGDVVAIRWGQSNPEFARSSLSEWLGNLEVGWPELPTDGSTALNGDGRLVWYSGPTRPPWATCDYADGNWWIALSGTYLSAFAEDEVFKQLGWQLSDRCRGGTTTIFALAEEPPAAVERSAELCVPDPRAEVTGRYDEVLHQSAEAFGETRIVSLPRTWRCPWPFTHSLRVLLAEPMRESHYSADLVAEDGAIVRGSWQGEDRVFAPSPESFHQHWAVPDGFVPSEFVMRIDDQLRTVPISHPSLPGPTLDQFGQILARLNRPTEEIELCFRIPNRDPICGLLGEHVFEGSVEGGWRMSPLLKWRVELPAFTASSLMRDPVGASDRCPPREELSGLVWQLNAGSIEASAIYVGDQQFLALADGVEGGDDSVSRGGLTLGVKHVATDDESGLALLVIPGVASTELLSPAVTFGKATPDWQGQTAWVVGWNREQSTGRHTGDERFSVSPVRVTDMVDQYLWVQSGLWSDRRGAPIIHPCTGEVLGVVHSSFSAIRAEAVEAALERMRTES